MKNIRISVILLPAFVWLASQALAGLTIQADKAAIKTVGQKTGGGAWNLWSDGDLGDYVKVAQTGTYKIVVRARGSKAKGIWPDMLIVVDGRAVETKTVNSAEFVDYAFRVRLSAGIRLVTAFFLNDAFYPPEDRNLYISRIEIHPPAGVAKPVLGTFKQWAVEEAGREQSILAEADRRIEKHRKGDAVIRIVDAAGEPVANARVAVEQTCHDFLFGSKISGDFDRLHTARENQLYKKYFADLFNYATVGFYWKWSEPVRGRPDYAYRDKIVAWCRENNIRLKGHPLLWDSKEGVPPWSKVQPSEQLQRQRVTEIMRRYAGKIEFWEVVNEPAHCTGIKIGQPYRWARKADPKAHLIVNDYQVLAHGCPPFFRLLQQAKRDGVPFDGVGIQAHGPRTRWFPLGNVQETLDKYAALGKDLHITEFTPASAGEPIVGSHIKVKRDENAQADYAVKFYRTCFAHPAVVAITWWDLCDQRSWLKGGGMLRANLTPKPVYKALKKLIHQDWQTRSKGLSDATGRYRFRGFYGQYAITVNGKAMKGRYKLARLPKDQLAVGEWLIQLSGSEKP